MLKQIKIEISREESTIRQFVMSYSFTWYLDLICIIIKYSVLDYFLWMYKLICIGNIQLYFAAIAFSTECALPHSERQ